MPLFDRFHEKTVYRLKKHTAQIQKRSCPGWDSSFGFTVRFSAFAITPLNGSFGPCAAAGVGLYVAHMINR